MVVMSIPHEREREKERKREKKREKERKREKRKEKEEKKSMIIVVPSCLKDADGARTRSDQ